MSANLLIDLDSTAHVPLLSVAPAAGVASTPASGAIIGNIVDLLNYDTYCNFFVAGSSSGSIRVAVQFSDDTTSGNFTDPTSGLAADTFPTLQSGGILHVNSGLWPSGGLPKNCPISGGPLFASGGVQFGSVIRPNRYGRLNILSGSANVGPVTAGFISQLRTTGSGGGFSWSPISGNAINV